MAQTFTVSLADSLPRQTFVALNTKNVIGTKYRELNGRDVRYFEYEATPEDVIRAVSTSPFSIEAEVADTVCYPLSAGEFAQLHTSVPENERSAFPEFWTDINVPAVFVNCIKTPLRHTLIFRANSRKILHRIEFI